MTPGPPDGSLDLFGQPVRKSASTSRARAADTAFSHSSERMFATLLDFYDIAWEYEPRSFDLATDEHGKATEQFTPDFYLPDHDLYVEVTTMAQRLVTRKNRKIRRLAQTHPEIRCRIFYLRDIIRLATKHGLQIPDEDFTAGEPE